MWPPVDPLIKDTIVGKKSPDYVHVHLKVCIKVLKLHCTVGDNKKFPFRLRSMVILQCDCSSKKGEKRNGEKLYTM